MAGGLAPVCLSCIDASILSGGTGVAWTQRFLLRDLGRAVVLVSGAIAL